jgi:anti-sigma-K factor RskA
MSTDIHALAGAYVLDAVDDLERRAFERHLDECPSCTVEVTELRETTARLADPTWSVPPPRLRADVLAAVARTRQTGPDLALPAERDPVVRRWRRFTAGAAAASILAVGAAAATWAVQEDRVSDARATAAAAEAEAARMKQLLSDPDEAARMKQILASPDVVIRTSPLSGGGKVTMAMSPSHNAGVVLFGASAAPASGQTFQVWFLDEQPKNAGVLPVGTTSAAMVMEGVTAHKGIGVTVERAGGAPTPSRDLVAQISLT